MPEGFHIRQALANDADVLAIAKHRASMFRDMGRLGSDAFDTLVARTQARLRGAVASGEYVGWLANPAENPALVVAGVGVQCRQILPFPKQGAGAPGIADGREAIVLNVFTEPPFRRQGLARALMQEVIAWAGATGVERLVLHAAPDGRPLYESLGFAPTNEMRLVEERTR